MIEITIDQESLDRMHRALATMDLDEQDNAILRGVTRGSVVALNSLIDKVSGDPIHVRTGDLRRSMGFHIENEEDGITGVVGSGGQSENPEIVDPTEGEEASDPMFRMIYANILEEGGTIRPVNAKMLAIPIGDALTPAGVARFTPLQLKNGQTSYVGSVIIDGIIFGLTETKTRSGMVPLFVLKDSVEIPAFHYMQEALDESQDEIIQAMIDEIEKGLNTK